MDLFDRTLEHDLRIENDNFGFCNHIWKTLMETLLDLYMHGP